VQPFVAEGILGTFDRRNLVRHFDEFKGLSQELSDAGDAVFIKADDANADEIRDIVFDFVRLFVCFQLAAVLAVKLLDTLLFVLDPPFDFADSIAIPLFEAGVDQADVSILGRLEVLPVAVVVFAEGAFFLVKIEGGHGSVPWLRLHD